MSTYILIHGDWHGGWCWNRVVPFLQQAGHRVLAPDLPGHGQDTTPLSSITQERIFQCLNDFLDSEVEPVTLVGHSSGGMLITALANLRPEKVKELVYLSAFLLPPGVTPRALAVDTESILSSALLVDEQRRVVTIKPEVAKAVFYADCTDADATWATRLLVPEPFRSPTQRVTPPLPETAWDAIPRVYITCLQDKALGPAMQKQMYTKVSCQKVYSLHTSHSPFLSAPSQLAAYLLDAVAL
ncbi:MAG TPA: alpha/beta fold hydrolase [Ktedonobacteraceae bacterium]|nr:alpha/beta fold hydrolase [Ktedonobacteraceae bacterium]